MSDAAPAADAGAPSAPKGPLILALLNTIVVLAAVGTMVYTRVLFKRPAITEASERERLEKTKPKLQAGLETGSITYEPFVANLEPVMPPKSAEQGTQPVLHYATIGFALEIGNVERIGTINSVRPQVMDKLLGLIGRKKHTDLMTVQGRYLLRSQIADTVNEMVDRAYGDMKIHPGELVTNVYFNQFVVQ